MPTYKSVIILTPNARRQTVKVTPNTTLLKVLEEASAKHGYNPKEFDLKHHNKIMDLDNVIRFTGLPNNALLEMVPAVKVRQDSEVFLGVQVESGERFTGTFMPSDSLWTLLCKLCPVEVSKDGNPVAIYMRTEVSGREKLEKTTLHSLGITGGRAMLRFMHRSPEELRVQANVSAPLVRPTPKTKIESLAVSSEETEFKNKQSSSPNANQLEVSSIKDEKTILSLSESEELKDRSPLHNEKLVCKHTKGDVSEPMEDSSISKEECSNQSREVKQGKETIVEASTVDKEEPMDVTDSKKHESDSNKSEPVLCPKDVPELVTEEEVKFLPGDHNGCVFSLNESQKMSAGNFAKDLPDEFYEVTIEDARVVMRDLKKRRAELEDAPLITSGLRYQQEMNKVIMPCVLRIMFPDRVVLQGSFVGGNTVEDVKEFVLEHIKYPHLAFFLYISPPKVILNPENLLYQIDGFPTIMVYFAYGSSKSTEEEVQKNVMTDKQYLKDDVLSNLTSQSSATKAALMSRGIHVNTSDSKSHWTGISEQPSTSRQEANREVKNKNRIVQPSKPVTHAHTEKLPKWFCPNK